MWVFPYPCLVPSGHLNCRFHLSSFVGKKRTTCVRLNECSAAPRISVSPLFGSDHCIAEDRNLMSTSMKQPRSVNQDVHPTFGADPMQKHRDITCRFHQAGYCRKGASCPFSHKPAHPHRKLRNCAFENRSFPVSQGPQSPFYHLPSSPTLPSSLWHPPYSVSHPVNVSHASPCPAATDSVLRDDPHDTLSSEGSSLCVKVPDHDLHAAFWSVENSGSPALPQPMAPYRPFAAAHLVPEHGSTDWMTYFTPCNAKADPYGRLTMLPFVAHPPRQSTVLGPEPRMRKPFAYRTKPCRHFVATGKCPRGDKCTFIHDSGSAKSTEKIYDTSTSIHAKELEPKANDCRSKDFHPITWRVIGGGVMMSGERTVCDAFVSGRCRDGDDCKFAHETELEMDPDGCLRLKREAEVPAAREAVREANGRGLKHTEEGPTLNPRRDYSHRKRPRDVSTSTTRVPVSTETSQKIMPSGRRTEEMNLAVQKMGEANIALEASMVKPLTFTVAHRRTRSMVGPSSLLHAQPNVTSPCFLAEF